MRSTYFVVFIFSTVTCVLAQIPGFGKCPAPPVKQNFDVDQYVGVWYEYQRYFAVFEFGLKCGRAEYTLKDDGHILVNNTGTKKWSGKSTEAIGDAFAPDPDEPAKIIVNFGGAPSTGKPNYWVLDTDYNTFSVVYSCADFGGFLHADILWLLSRDKAGLPDDLTNQLRSRLEQQGLRTKYLMNIKQDGCTNY
ncbi:apolipoprotein D [Lingula anatina]|uniref:Apolipoprotein D n=1 Tax=Lingula anatina TaxID=7574 RepID=A0A1S3HLM7_LINAN|nr:apolipoprotein D [Lingula anatina]|eukprot:XP_013385924.1 apolipoprotein D [Lingula anatina]